MFEASWFLGERNAFQPHSFTLLNCPPAFSLGTLGRNKKGWLKDEKRRKRSRRYANIESVTKVRSLSVNLVFSSVLLKAILTCGYKNVASRYRAFFV